MEYLALALSIAALLLALAARARAGGQSALVEDTRSDARRLTNNLAEEMERQLQNLRQLLAQVAGGEELSRQQILDGQLWKDVDPAEGQALVETGEVNVLDVRTAQEVASGVIPGAQWIPIEELERRAGEVPRDGRRTLVYCAGGGRSAAACEFLTGQGLSGLHNLAGGISSWSGPIEKRP